MFKLSAHPAFITVTQGVQDAFHYLSVTWQKWLPVIVAIGVCTAILNALVGSVTASDLYYTDRFTGHVVWYQNAGTRVWQLIAVGGLTQIMTTVGSWVFYATAISGLRNRPLTAAFILERGLLVFVAGLLVGLAVVFGVFVLVVVLVIVPPMGVLLLFAAIPALIYFAIRVVFYSLAIFDGHGPIEGIKESWSLSRGSVLRLFGWALMAGLIGLGFSLVGSLLSAPFTTSNSAWIGQGLLATVVAAGTCFSAFMLAVLYESQRARRDPAAYGLPVGPAPWGPAPYAAWPNPYAAGPAPYAQGYPGAAPAYPGSQPQGWGPPNAYAAPPQDPTAIPGWVNPNAPQAWPGYPPANMGWGAPPAPQGWPVNPNVPPAWGPGSNVAPGTVPDASPATPPSEPKPTDPPPAG